MRGPIDYIIVGFEGNKFDGSILKAVGDAIETGAIALVGLTFVTKDEAGNALEVDIESLEDSYAVDFWEKYATEKTPVDDEDITEVTDLLENNTSAGLLIVEQLWAIPLKQALLDANGVLVAEGRIHPDAAAELNEGGN